MSPCESWDALVARAAGLGYEVQLVEYAESAESPGLLGHGLGVCLYGSKVIRIREVLREDDRRFVLTHELEHAANEDQSRAWHDVLDAQYHARSDTMKRHESIAAYLWPLEEA